MLLLNGGFMSIPSWDPCAAAQAEHWRVLRCDFRGQFRTPGPAHRELAGNVGDVVTLLDHLDLGRVHVLGTSLGGLVGLLLAARHPERVASLVAVTVGDYATEIMRESAREMRQVIDDILAGGDPGRFHDVLVRDVYSAGFVAENRETLAARRQQIAAFSLEWFEAAGDILAAVETFDLRPELGSIRCPTLVVVAGDDRAMPPERGRAVAAAIQGAALVEHPESGHALVTEHPKWLAERALEHFARAGDRRGERG